MDEYMVVQQLMNLYCFDMMRYRYMTKDGKYHTVKAPYDERLVFEHLAGEKTMCVYARERNTVFETFDIDESDQENVRLLIEKLESCGISRDKVYVSTSGNKGYHVDIFFDAPVWKSDVENFYNYLISDPEIAKIRMESKPGRNGAIKVPLGINFRTGRRCWYLDRETLEPIERTDYVFEIEKICAEDFAQIVYICNKEKKKADIMRAKASPCKVHRPKKFVARNEPTVMAPGQRHDKMLKKAVWLRAVGGDADEIYDELIKWVNRQDPSLIGSSWKEIEDDACRIANDVAKHYEVKAKQKREFSHAAQAISREDMEIILGAPTKTARKAAFLICAYCRAFGMCSMGYDRMAQVLGVTYQTAFNAVKVLIECGVIEKKKVGGVAYSDGKPVLVANEYAWITKQSDGGIRFTISEVSSDFMRVYYRALCDIFDQDILEKRLTRSELEELKKWK